MLKHSIVVCAALMSLSAHASTGEMSSAEFFTREKERNWTGSLATEDEAPRYERRRVVERVKGGKSRVRWVTVKAEQGDRRRSVADVRSVELPANDRKRLVAQIVAEETARVLGQKWVPTALKLAHIESSYNCGAVGPRTRHGHARGVLQVMPGSARALGFNPGRLNECRYGVAAGVAHMAACVQSGVTNHSQMAACHVSGVQGWKARLNPRAEKYRRQYIRLAQR